MRIVKLKEVIKHRKGFITIDDNAEYKLCKVQLHRRGVVIRNTVKGAEIRTKKQQVCKTNDFIVAEMDAKFGGYGFVPDELDGAIVSSHYFLFDIDTQQITKGYLDLVCHLGILQSQIKAVGSTNYSAVRPSIILEWEIPLPHIEHQRKLENLFKTTKELRNDLELELTHQLSLVKQLRQAFLREAMQGKLVPQNPADGHAKDLLAQIKAEKAKLGKKEKPLQPIKPEEIPFEIPEGWVWCRLGEVVLHSEAGKSLKADEISANTGELGVIKTSAITSGVFDESANKKFKNPTNNFQSIKICKGDLIFCRASGSKGLAGISCIVDEQPAPELILSDKTIRFFLGSEINKHFINLYNSSSFAKDYYMKLGTGKSTSMNNITREQFYNLPIPVPPTIVQDKILERIQDLMGFGHELEQNIEKGRGDIEQLLQQVLTESLSN